MIRPTVTSVFDDVSFLKCRLYKSMVKMVDAELSIDASELITAPEIAAKINPRIPTGIRFFIKKRICRITGHCKLIFVQLSCHDSRKDYYERDGEFEACRKEDTELALFKALGCQSTLGYILIQSPVIEIGNPQAKNKCRPRDNRVVAGEYHMQFIGIGFEKIADTADSTETENQCNCPSDYQCRSLKQVSPCDSF